MTETTGRNRERASHRVGRNRSGWSILVALAVVLGVMVPAAYIAGCRVQTTRDQAPKPASVESTLVSSLAEELTRTGRSERLRLYEVGDQVREAIDATPHAKVRFKTRVPENASIYFSYAVAERDWDRSTASMIFNVYVHDTDGTLKRVFRREAIRPPDEGSDPWTDAAVKLDAFQGRVVDLIFQVVIRPKGPDSPPTPFEGRPLWSGVRVLSRPTDSEKSKPNIVWITLDTLRADHLHCYGYERETSPRIDALAQRGVRFANAFSHCPWTRPSVAAMLWSQYPTQIWNREALDSDFTVESAATPNLPGILRDTGYLTAAFVNQPMLGYIHGFGLGFGRYAFLGDDEGVVNHMTEWLGRRDAGRPFFVYMHIMGGHAPYQFVNGISDKFISESVGTPVSDRYPGVMELRRDKPQGEELANLIALYDGEILDADRRVGLVLDALETAGLSRNTIVVVTADHGEEFGEHGSYDHGHSFYDELLHVPLIIAIPDETNPRTEASLVGLVDVAPTLARMTGATVPQSFAGRDLWTESKDDQRVILSENTLYGPSRSSLRTTKMKYIFPLSMGGTEEVYNLVDDPGEHQNRITDLDWVTQARQLYLDFFNTDVGVRRDLSVLLEFSGKTAHDWQIRYDADDDASPVFAYQDNRKVQWTENDDRKGGTLKFRTDPDKEFFIILPIRPLTSRLTASVKVDGRALKPEEFEAGGVDEPALSILDNLAAPDSLRALAAKPKPPADQDATVAAYMGLSGSSMQLLDPSDLHERLRSLGYLQ